jgi:hypothetical protein
VASRGEQEQEQEEKEEQELRLRVQVGQCLMMTSPLSRAGGMCLVCWVSGSPIYIYIWIEIRTELR